jgi:hypothetical protein
MGEKDYIPKKRKVRIPISRLLEGIEITEMSPENKEPQQVSS